jgi:hypothetical protein
MCVELWFLTTCNSSVAINISPTFKDQGLYVCRSFKAPLLSKRKVDDTTISLRRID